MEGEGITTETQPAQTVQKAPESSVNSNTNAQQEKLFLELKKATHSLLDRKGENIESELAGKSEDEKREILQKDDGKRHLKILHDLKGVYPGDHKTESDPNGIDFTKGNPVFIKIEGQPKKVLYIEAADEKNFICRLEGLDEVQIIPREKVYDAQLLSEKDSVLTALQGGEKELVETYIKSLSGEQIPAEYAQKLMDEQRTIPSEDKLIAEHIGAIKQEIETLKNASQDTKKQEELLRKLTIGQMANGPAGIIFKIEVIKSLQEAGYSDIPEITEQQKRMYQDAQDKIFEIFQQANISKEELQEIQEGFTKGNPNIIINEIVINKIKGVNTNRLEQLIFEKEMTEEELVNILSPDEKMKALWEKHKKLGKGFLLILLIALLGVGSFGKSVTGQG